MFKPLGEVADQTLGFHGIVLFPGLTKSPANTGMKLRRKPVQDIPGRVDLTALNGDVGAEGAADGLAQRLGAIHHEEPADIGVEVAVNEVVEKRLDHLGVFGRALHHTQWMLLAVDVDAHRADHQEVFIEMHSIDLDDHQIELRKVGRHPVGELLLGQGDKSPGNRRFRKPRAICRGNRRIRLGGFAGASFASLNTDAGTQEIDANSYYAGLYAGFTMSEAFLNLALTGGYTSQSTSRDVLNNMVVGGVEQAKGDPNGIFISPSATIGTDIDTGGMIFTPSLRARYAGLFMDSYDENGSTADLSVDARSINLFDLRGQVAFAIAPMQTDGGHFDAALRLGADATYTNSEDVNATLLGQSLNFNVSDDDTTVRGFAGLDLAYETDSGANFTLTGEAGYDTSDALTLTGTAGLAWAF